MSKLNISYVDVFGARPLLGNPVAVVHDAQALTDDSLAAIARWTNLSETTFLLPAQSPDADYRLRIFTPGGELPFAGHPTLGSCHAWLQAGGRPAQQERIVQECELGLIDVRLESGTLAFAAPPLRRSGPLDAALRSRIGTALAVPDEAIVAAEWVDNGPGWCALLLDSAARVLELQPDFGALAGLALGVIGPHESGSAVDFEVRAFVPDMGVPEDPVTGSLNAGLAQWLIGAELAPDRYVAGQGRVLGRDGRVFIERDNAGVVWIGGAACEAVVGTLTV